MSNTYVYVHMHMQTTFSDHFPQCVWGRGVGGQLVGSGHYVDLRRGVLDHLKDGNTHTLSSHMVRTCTYVRTLKFPVHFSTLCVRMYTNT